MKPIPASHRPAFSRAAAAGLALLLTAPGVLAQYKVVSPDGSVSYTDRPPITSNARILNIGRPGSAGTPVDIGLPPDLRTAVQRHPVTLYTSADCEPCDTGRRLLQQRGVPYAEKRVATDDDAAALERLVGGRTVPSLTIGAQPLRGLSQTDWSAFLDAAGYPRESKLPRGWQAAETTPLVEQRAAPRTPPAAAPARPAEPAVPAAAPGAIRF